MSREAFEVCAETMAMTDTYLSPAELRGKLQGEQAMIREAFEAWYDRYFTEACERFGGIDCSDPKGVAEEAWQAAQADAFERAAKLCRKIADDPEYGDLFADGAAECAEAIRALVKKSNL